MADDIDDLLDEVETKFCANSPQKGAKSSSNSRNRPPLKNEKLAPKTDKPKRKDDELSAIIDDICDLPDPIEKLSAPESNRVVTSAQKRCYPIYLGGSICAQGLANSSTQRSCDRLRCTDCDFKCCVFNDFEWHSSTDYLFLRNNVPDFEKLRDKLIPKKGARAYACQCRWMNISKLMDLKKETTLKWVCGKH